VKIKSERDFCAALLFLLLAIGFAVGALNRWLGSAAQPGPGYFPLLLSAVLALLGIVLLFKSLTIEVEGGDAVGAIAWRPLLAVLAALVVFGLTLLPLGLVPAAALLALLAGLGTPGSSWRSVLLGVVLLGAASWLVFGWAWPQALPLALWPRAWAGGPA
jgi:hypothetical protein